MTEPSNALCSRLLTFFSPLTNIICLIFKPETKIPDQSQENWAQTNLGD